MDSKEKDLIEKAKDTINKYKDVDGGIEIITETMNNLYRYFKGVITKANLSDERLFCVFNVERLLGDKFLPLESEPIFNVENPPVFPDVIETEEDCEKAVSYIVYETRNRLNTKGNIKTDTLEKRCSDSSIIVEKVCNELGVNQYDFSCDENLGPGLFHCFNVVSFELPDGSVKMYLVDCTYRQFFTYADSFVERIGMPFNAGAGLGTFMMMDDKRKEMAEGLLTNGYMEFNATNIKFYFDGFVFAGRNGLYYEKLGKSTIEKSDYEPHYTYTDYLYALNNGGLRDEVNIGRQLGVLKEPIVFESGNTNIKTNQNK